MVSPVRNNDGTMVGILELRGAATPSTRLEVENMQAFPLFPSDLEGIAEGVVVTDREYKSSTGVDRLLQ
jgi:hypothetical protein